MSDKKKKIIGAVLTVLFVAILLWIRPSLSGQPDEREDSDPSVVSMQAHEPDGASEVYEADDSSEVYEADDSSEVYEVDDSTEVYEADDSSEVYEADDSTEVYEADGSSEVYEADASSKESEKTVTAKPDETAALLKFRNKKLLNQHYEKHGKDMGFANAQEYEAAASAVVANPNALHKEEKEDGDDIYYLEETNEFVVVSKDGYLRTYFLPDSGIKYYNKQ